MKLLIKNDKNFSNNEFVLLDLQGSIEVEGQGEISIGNLDFNDSVSFPHSFHCYYYC